MCFNTGVISNKIAANFISVKVKRYIDVTLLLTSHLTVAEDHAIYSSGIELASTD